MHARRLVIHALATALLAGCPRRAGPVVDARVAEDPDAFAPGAPRAQAPACRLADVAWAQRGAEGEAFDGDAGLVVRDAGDAMFPAIESAAASLAGDGSAWAVWSDARDGRVRVAHAQGTPAVVNPGAGNRGDVALALAGEGGATPVLAWTHDVAAQRVHTVRVGPTMGAGCEQPEARDEALALGLARTSRGALLAWDDEGPAPAAGSVKVALVALPAGTCGAPRQVSPPDQDAGDPVLAAAPDGGVVAFWLAARDLDPTENNDTVTDLWGVALDAAGAPQGRALRITTTPGHRFGLSASVAPDGASAWVAYRTAPESGTESRGDGGQVALARIVRTPNGLARAGDPVVMSAPDANPTGAPRVFARAAGDAAAVAWWRERRQGAVVTLHRAVDAAARALGAAPVEEPAMHGELPVWSDASGGAAVVVRTPGGGVAVARYRCDAPGPRG